MNQSFEICWDSTCDLALNQFLKMFHDHLKGMCILQLLFVLLNTSLLDQVCCVVQNFSIFADIFFCLVLYQILLKKNSHYSCEFVYFFFMPHQFSLYIFWDHNFRAHKLHTHHEIFLYLKWCPCNKINFTYY